MDVTHGQAAHEALRKWLEVERISYSELARRCSSERNKFIAKQITRVVVDGQTPPPQLAGALEELLGIPASVWREEPPPASEDRPTPRALGTTHEELRTTVQEIDAVRAKGGLTPNQDAALLGKRASVLAALARCEDRAKLEDHPDIDAFLDDVLAALERTLEARGVPSTGARSEFADHLEAIEAERARRAA